MQLSQHQIQHIRSFVEKSGVRTSTLRDDLIDHICCEIEINMADSADFQVCLETALKNISPFGLSGIQVQTDFLVHSNYFIMKRLMYLIGLFTTISVSMGLTMKILHMPGAEELTNYGFLAFLLIFLPMLAINQWRSKTPRPFHDRLRTILGFISAVGVGMAVFYKMTHQLDLSSNLLLASMTIFSFGFLPCLFYGMYTREIINTK